MKTNSRNILFVLLAYAAGLMTAYVLCNSLTAYRNERIASLEREVLRLDSLVNQATEILHHERLMHFEIASGDVEKIMREKASGDVKNRL
jgi:hypothetical protein